MVSPFRTMFGMLLINLFDLGKPLIILGFMGIFGGFLFVYSPLFCVFDVFFDGYHHNIKDCKFYK